MKLAILPCLHVIIISDYLENFCVVDFLLKVYELHVFIFLLFKSCSDFDFILSEFCRLVELLPGYLCK